MQHASSERTVIRIIEEKFHAIKCPYADELNILKQSRCDCYHYNTKFLTTRGWLNYDDITEDDFLATINTNTHELEWQHYIIRIDKEVRNLYDVETKDTHFCVTKNHNVYTSNIVNINKNGHIYNAKNANWKFSSLEIEKSKQFHKHIIAFPLNANKDYDISDDELKLLGAFVSDGTINFRKDVNKHQKIKSMKITQTSQGKKEFFEMMDSIDIENVHKYTYSKETVWVIGKKIATQFFEWCGYGSKHIRLPKWFIYLSTRQAKVLLNALLLGDGTFDNRRDVYYTSNILLAEDVFTLALLAGNFAVLQGGNNGYKAAGNFGSVNMWHVQIKHRTLSPSYVFFKDGKNIHAINNETNRVVCFEVPNHTLVTMFDGKSAVQGNCKQLHNIPHIEEFVD